MAKKKRNETYIKLYRSTLDTALFNVKPFDDWRAFEYLCLKARVKPCELVLSDGTIIHLKRGQHFESKTSLAEKFGWSVKKLKGWERRMKRLKMVLAEGLAKGTTYTVENYTFYQGEGLAEGLAEGLTEVPTEVPSKKNVKECIKKDARACEDITPRGVVPMNDEIRQKLKKTIKSV